MSRGGRSGRGIGHDFLSLYLSDVFPSDECIVNGHPTRPPRYYDNIYELSEPEQMETIRAQRIKIMEHYLPDNTRPRLRDKETVKIAQTKSLKRGNEQ